MTQNLCMPSKIRFIGTIYNSKSRVSVHLYLLLVATHMLVMIDQPKDTKEKLIGVTKTKLKVINDRPLFQQATMQPPLTELM